MTSICMVSDDFLPAATGVGIHLQLVAPELVRRGCRVCILTTRRPGEPEVEDWQGVTVYRLFTLKLFGFYQAVATRGTIRRILERERPDVVHHHYVGLMLTRAFAVAEDLGIRQVYTYHMTADHLTQPLPMRPLRGPIDRWIVAYCNRFESIISPSANLAATLPGKGIRTRVRHISNPVAFTTAEVPRALRQPGFTVMFAGRLEREKNLDLLIDAFAILHAARPESRLCLAGQGSQRAHLERRIGGLGLGAAVEFTGFLDHAALAARYAACDVFVLPSLVETQGMVAMEAMWFRRPVVLARSIVSATELVDEGGNGHLVDPVDPRDLAARLLSLAADPGLRAAMGEAGHQRMLPYTVAAVAGGLLDVYQHPTRLQLGRVTTAA